MIDDSPHIPNRTQSRVRVALAPSVARSRSPSRNTAGSARESRFSNTCHAVPNAPRASARFWRGARGHNLERLGGSVYLFARLPFGADFSRVLVCDCAVASVCFAPAGAISFTIAPERLR